MDIVIETCRRHGVEPLAYLDDVLRRLPAIKAEEVPAITPKRWKESRQIKTVQ